MFKAYNVVKQQKQGGEETTVVSWERTTAGCERHTDSGLGRLVGDLCSQNSGFFDVLRQLVCDGGWTMHVGVSRCPVTCVLLLRGARLSCTLLCFLQCLSFVRAFCV